MDTSGHDMAGSAQENPPVAHVALVYDVMVAHLSCETPVSLGVYYTHMTIPKCY